MRHLKKYESIETVKEKCSHVGKFAVSKSMQIYDNDKIYYLKEYYISKGDGEVWYESVFYKIRGDGVFINDDHTSLKYDYIKTQCDGDIMDSCQFYKKYPDLAILYYKINLEEGGYWYKQINNKLLECEDLSIALETEKFNL